MQRYTNPAPYQVTANLPYPLNAVICYEKSQKVMIPDKTYTLWVNKNCANLTMYIPIHMSACAAVLEKAGAVTDTQRSLFFGNALNLTFLLIISSLTASSCITVHSGVV